MQAKREQTDGIGEHARREFEQDIEQNMRAMMHANFNANFNAKSEQMRREHEQEKRDKILAFLVNQGADRGHVEMELDGGINYTVKGIRTIMAIINMYLNPLNNMLMLHQINNFLGEMDHLWHRPSPPHMQPPSMQPPNYFAPSMLEQPAIGAPTVVNF